MSPFDPKAVRLLHLSDLHRADDGSFSASAAVEALLDDLEQVFGSATSAPAIDVIVVSGDLVQSGDSKREYKQTADFLSCLYGKLFPKFSATGDKSRLVLVPGNHDVAWEQCRRALCGLFDETVHEIGKHLNHENAADAVYFVRELHRKKFANFARLLKEQTGLDWQNDFEKQVQEYPVFAPDAGAGVPGLVFLGLNSAYLVRHDRNDAGLDADAMAAAKMILRRKYPADTWIRVLVQHHPISSADPPPDDHIQYLGLSSLLRDVSLVLHGHLHRHSPRQQAQLGGGNVPAIAAGTLFATTPARPDVIGHEYNLVVVDILDRQASIYPRTRDELGQPWRTDNRWTGDNAIFYSMPLHDSKRTPQRAPATIATKSSFAPADHPSRPIDDWAPRCSLFEPLLQFAQERDIVFAIGGAGSGLKTFLAEFQKHLGQNDIRHYSAADFEIETFQLIRKAREKQNKAISPYAKILDGDQIDLKCLLASLAYATYYTLRQEFASAIDGLVPSLFQDDPVQFANHYFNRSGAMFKAEVAPIIQHFFESIQWFVEATDVKRLIVFMPWQNLSRCFQTLTEPTEKKAAKDFWDALASFASGSSEKSSLSPFSSRPTTRTCDRYDKVCVVIAGTRVPVGHKPPKTSLVSKSIWPIPPLDAEDIKFLLRNISESLDTDAVAAEVLEWTAGAPWFVRHLLSYVKHHHTITERQPDVQHPDAAAVLASATIGAGEAISGDPGALPVDYRDFVTRHADAVREELGGGDSTDSVLVEYWTAPPHKRRRGFDIQSPRIEAWISSGLVWFDGTVWDIRAEDHLFRDYPTVYFREAGRLPLSLYNAIKHGDVEPKEG